MPPLVTDIDLSMDDRFLYVACWGTGEMRQYDVTDPRKPKLAGGSVHVGGIARHEAAGALINANLGMAVLVSVVHSVAMIAPGGFLAWLVYRYLGLKRVAELVQSGCDVWDSK